MDPSLTSIEFRWILVLGFIDLIAKGFGMWKAAKLSQRNWFVAMLVINSAGILPAIYLQFFQKKHPKGS